MHTHLINISSIFNYEDYTEQNKTHNQTKTHDTIEINRKMQ